jgi:hypothetical protein
VFEITPAESWIKFHVKASTTIAGKFDNWDAKSTFTSPDETAGLRWLLNNSHAEKGGSSFGDPPELTQSRV